MFGKHMLREPSARNEPSCGDDWTMTWSRHRGGCLSRVLREQVELARHPSPVTRHPSPVTRHPSDEPTRSALRATRWWLFRDPAVGPAAWTPCAAGSSLAKIFGVRPTAGDCCLRAL